MALNVCISLQHHKTHFRHIERSHSSNAIYLAIAESISQSIGISIVIKMLFILS